MRLDAIEPNAAVQRELAAVAAATNQAELDRAIGQLRQAIGSDTSAVMPQLVYFSMRAGDVREGMTPAVVVRELHITPEQQLAGLTPYLAASDERLAHELRQYLGNIDGSSATQPPDLRHYLPLLRAKPDASPTVLIQYLLESQPDQGLVVLVDAYVAEPARRESLLAACRDPAGLSTLAADPTWWVRLYVAERLRQDPSVRTPDLLQRLRADPHPLVRQAIADN